MLGVVGLAGRTLSWLRPRANHRAEERDKDGKRRWEEEMRKRRNRDLAPAPDRTGENHLPSLLIRPC